MDNCGTSCLTGSVELSQPRVLFGVGLFSLPLILSSFFPIFFFFILFIGNGELQRGWERQRNFASVLCSSKPCNMSVRDASAWAVVCHLAGALEGSCIRSRVTEPRLKLPAVEYGPPRWWLKLLHHQGHPFYLVLVCDFASQAVCDSILNFSRL